MVCLASSPLLHRRRAPVARRAGLLAVAEHLVQERGYHGTTLVELGRAARRLADPSQVRKRVPRHGVAA